MVDNLTSGEAGALSYRPIDAAAYERRSREGPCFVCETLASNPDYPGHIVWTDEDSVAFLAAYSTLLGHTLVAARAHREQVTGDFGMQEYLGLQRLVYQIGEALRGELPTERLYIMSLGSQPGNRHVTGTSRPSRPESPMSSSSSPPSPGNAASWTCQGRNSPPSPSASALRSNGCGRRRSVPATCPEQWSVLGPHGIGNRWSPAGTSGRHG
jgi:diadenosine tetraphosphate (Ap4A) HIT family hydrolase